MALRLSTSAGTFVDGLIAAAVLAGLALNAAAGAWWADPAAGYVLVSYAVKESWHTLRGGDTEEAVTAAPM